MLVKDLPQDIKDVVIKHHVKQRGKNLLTDSSRLIYEFSWNQTPEGDVIWNDVHHGHFKSFRKFHHNQLKPGDTVEYFKRIEQADWNEFGVEPVSIKFELGDKLKINSVSSNDDCTIHFEKHYFNFPSHCFRKVEVVEEPQHPFKVGDRVRIKKEFLNLFKDDDLKHDTFIVDNTHKYSCFVPHSLENCTDKNVIVLKPGYGGWYLAECFELHVEQPKEEPVEDFKAGDTVVYYREPTSSDWENIGETDIQFKIGKKLIIKEVHHHVKSLLFYGSYGYYPASCFRKVTEQTKVLNPIHQHYEDGGKIREKFWNKEEWIKKYSETHSIDNGNIIGDDYLWSFKSKPEDWEIFVEQDDKRTSKKIISVSETTLSKVPEYWYFPLNGCTDDELDKFQRFKEDKASFYKDNKIRKSHILLNFHWDKSYYYTDRVEELIKETWFKPSAVQLTKEEFYRLIYNPWQDKQSKSGKIIEKIEPSSAHAVTETDEIIITSLKRKSKLRLLSTNVENLDVKLTTLKPQKQKV